MKNKIIISCLLIFPILLCAQEKSGEKISRVNFYLEAGHKFKLDQTSVRFLNVISDSRCPRQVTCIWPGEAKVKLGITLDGEYFEKEVVVGTGGADFSLSEALQLQVSHLLPYPETGAGIAPEEYSIRFAALVSE
ncbi:hypothetical protein [Salinimicrobium terrae]|uniref:hypothetical protein n=1 Tax=Salinimicrobium terrae TaxID=470866 RepID=UPI00040234EE|nr:hypothetical protein [Salinimicrobium terrae]